MRIQTVESWISLRVSNRGPKLSSWAQHPISLQRAATPRCHPDATRPRSNAPTAQKHDAHKYGSHEVEEATSAELLAIRAPIGDFFTRRLRRFTRKTCRDRGWEHRDDLSIAGVAAYSAQDLRLLALACVFTPAFVNVLRQVKRWTAGVGLMIISKDKSFSKAVAQMPDPGKVQGEVVGG